MNIYRAILCGALLWVLIFFEVSILMFGFKLETGTTYYAIHYLALFFLALIVSLVYFKGKIKKGISQGIGAGIVFLLTGVLLDVMITVPLFVKTYSFFNDVLLWIGMLETFLVVVIVSGYKK